MTVVKEDKTIFDVQSCQIHRHSITHYKQLCSDMVSDKKNSDLELKTTHPGSFIIGTLNNMPPSTWLFLI